VCRHVPAELAPLLRDVQGMEKNFPDQPEVRAFVATRAPLPAAAFKDAPDTDPFALLLPKTRPKRT
jgi:hypothetical protein